MSGGSCCRRTYFTTEPFENWTRSDTEIMGSVEFDVDFSVPFNDMRAELDRLLAESELWDGRRGVLQVTDAVGGVVRVRIVVSAPNAGALFDLRCAVREGMVDWVQHRQVLPTQRIEPTAPASEPPQAPRRRRRDAAGGVRPVLRQPRGRRARPGVRRARRLRGRLRPVQRHAAERVRSARLRGTAGPAPAPAASSGSVSRSVRASTKAPSSAPISASVTSRACCSSRPRAAK